MSLFLPEELHSKIIKSVTFYILFCSSVGYSDDTFTTLLIPDVSPQYSKVFDQIEEGFSNVFEGPFDKYKINLNNTDNHISGIVKNSGYRYIIALSPPIANAVSIYRSDATLISGAIGSPPNKTGEIGVSLYIHPSLYFERLKALSPNVRRVRAVMNPNNGKYHQQQAIKSAARFGIELILYQATNYRDAARMTDKIFKESISNFDAVWITRDVLVFSRETLLTYYIEKSWDNEIVTMSYSPIDVKRGVLFSLFTSYKDIGLQIGGILNEYTRDLSKNKGITRLRYLKSPKLAINYRTARHLRLNSKLDVSLDIDVEYPSK